MFTKKLSRTDNAHIERKIALRRLAVEGIDSPRVLDAFAGENRLWSGFRLGRYYGIEKEQGKGSNLWADNVPVLKSLDLSGFDVIDLDAYGTVIPQLEAVLANPTLRDGTVLVFTEIHSPLSGLPNRLRERVKDLYAVYPTAFNYLGYDLFQSYMRGLGFRRYVGYVSRERMYVKMYGFVRVTPGVRRGARWKLSTSPSARCSARSPGRSSPTSWPT